MDSEKIVTIERHQVMKEPIYLGLINKITLEEDSEATVIESSSALKVASDFQMNTKVTVGKNARLTFIKILDHENNGNNTSTFFSEQDSGSVVRSQVFDLRMGTGSSQNEIRASLNGEGAECYLDGLYILGQDQTSKHYTTVEHRVPHATSEELYKGILSEKSVGDFSGKIVVHPQAQKTIARQMNRNLLLSKDAMIFTKPLLEIFANDVKCNHGAAIGRLDEKALFYLRSRGIDLIQAQQLLTQAYAHDMVERIVNPELKKMIRDLVFKRLDQLKIEKVAA